MYAFATHDTLGCGGASRSPLTVDLEVESHCISQTQHAFSSSVQEAKDLWCVHIHCFLGLVNIRSVHPACRRADEYRILTKAALVILLDQLTKCPACMNDAV